MFKRPTMSRAFSGLLVAVLALPLPAAAQKGAFSLDFSLRDADGDRVRSDGGPYVDRSDPGGRTPGVYAIDGNIAVELEGSTRRICLDFSAGPVGAAAGPIPVSGCYAAKVHVRFGITDLAAGQQLLLSFVVYWTGPGSDGLLHDYDLGFRPRMNNPVLATGINANSWTVDQTSIRGVVSLFKPGKNGGWHEVADFEMPFAAVANRLIPNLRGK